APGQAARGGEREPRQGRDRLPQIARSAAADVEDATLSRRRRTELCRLHRVRRLSMGADGEPVQADRGGRSYLCLAREAVRRLWRHGAASAGLCFVGSDFLCALNSGERDRLDNETLIEMRGVA